MYRSFGSASGLPSSSVSILMVSLNWAGLPSSSSLPEEMWLMNFGVAPSKMTATCMCR